MTRKYTLLIAEDHSILRAGLCALLRAEPGLDVIGETASGDEALQLVEKFSPDLVMTDFNLQAGTGTDLIEVIKGRYPGTKILVLTQHTTETSIRKALRAGANGYVLKDASNAELIMAVRSVLAGKIYLSPSISDKVVNAFLVGTDCAGMKSPRNALTGREREILKLIAEGRTSKFIADHLGLSIKTVEKHRSNLMRKLDLHNVSALTTFAIGQGLVVAVG